MKKIHSLLLVILFSIVIIPLNINLTYGDLIYHWYTIDEIADNSCSEWAALNGRDCNGVFDKGVMRTIARTKISRHGNDPFSVFYRVHYTEADSPYYASRDGTMGGYGSQYTEYYCDLGTHEINNKDDDSILKSNPTMPSNMVLGLFRVTNNSSASPAKDIKDKFYAKAQAIICAKLQFRNLLGSSAVVLAGCVEEPPMPIPPTFNEIITTKLVPYIESSNMDAKFFQDIHSTFEAPAIKMVRYSGETGLTLAFKDVFKYGVQSAVCDFFKDDLSKKEYCAFIPYVGSGEICAYEGKEVDDTKKIGCIKRPSIEENSQYSIIANYITVCDLATITAGDLSLNDDDRKYDSVNYKCKNDKLKPYQAVQPILINSKFGKNIATDDQGNAIFVGINYNLYTSVKGITTLYKKTIFDLEQNKQLYSDVKIKPLSTISTTTKQNIIGLKEYFIFNIPQSDPSLSDSSQKYNTIYMNDNTTLDEAKVNITTIIPSINSKNAFTYSNLISNKVDMKNCNTYTISDQGTKYLLPADSEKRGREYCYCKDCDEEKDKDCSCPICKSVDQNMSISYSACPGVYLGKSKSNNNDSNIVPEQICFYVKSGWDFISGKTNQDNNPGDIVCASLPSTCDPMTTPADWNGHGLWKERKNFGENDIIGQCADEYIISKKYKSILTEVQKCDEFAKLSESAAKQFIKDFPQAQKQWGELIQQAKDQKQNISIQDISVTELKEYIITFPTCTKIEGDETPPLADCIGGIYSNFRNPCYKKQ